MEHLAHLEAPIVLILLSWLALAAAAIYLWWTERRRK